LDSVFHHSHASRAIAFILTTLFSLSVISPGFVLSRGQEVPMLRASLASLDEDQQRGILIFRDPEHFLFRPLEVTTGIGKALR
jgi:hypothetical protein